MLYVVLVYHPVQTCSPCPRIKAHLFPLSHSEKVYVIVINEEVLETMNDYATACQVTSKRLRM